VKIVGKVADEADPLVASFDQVLDGRAHAPPRCRAGSCPQRSVPPGRSMKTIATPCAISGSRYRWSGRRGARRSSPSNPALEQLADEVALPASGCSSELPVISSMFAGAQHLLDATRDRGVERVADVADDQAERARGVPLAQRARRIVAPEAELVDGDPARAARSRAARSARR